MTFSINKVCLAGNVGGEPDVKKLSNGKRIANLMLATNEAWTHLGKSLERVDWHRVVFLSEGLVAYVEEYVRNGSPIYVEGKLQVRKYKDAAAAGQVSIEVVVSHPHGCLQMVRPGVRGSMEGQVLTYDRVFARADVPAA